MSTQADLEAVATAIRERDRFLVTSHENPDGDALGSMLALGAGLRSLGKTVVASWGGGAADPKAIGTEGHRRLYEDFVEAVISGKPSRAESRRTVPPLHEPHIAWWCGHRQRCRARTGVVRRVHVGAHGSVHALSDRDVVVLLAARLVRIRLRPRVGGPGELPGGHSGRPVLERILAQRFQVYPGRGGDDGEGGVHRAHRGQVACGLSHVTAGDAQHELIAARFGGGADLRLVKMLPRRLRPHGRPLHAHRRVERRLPGCDPADDVERIGR